MAKATEMTADEVLLLYHDHIETIKEQLRGMLKTHRPAEGYRNTTLETDLLSDISYFSETLRPWDEGEEE